MSNTPNLDALQQSISFIQALLDDPQPGIPSWRAALSSAVDNIRPEQNEQGRVDDNIFPFSGLALPPVGVGPFSPSGEHADLTNDPFRLDIVARKQEVFDFKELTFSITDGYGNLAEVLIRLGRGGTVDMRVASPLNSNGPDLNVKLFNARLP